MLASGSSHAAYSQSRCVILNSRILEMVLCCLNHGTPCEIGKEFNPFGRDSRPLAGLFMLLSPHFNLINLFQQSGRKHSRMLMYYKLYFMDRTCTFAPSWTGSIRQSLWMIASGVEVGSQVDYCSTQHGNKLCPCSEMIDAYADALLNLQQTSGAINPFTAWLGSNTAF